MRASVLPATLGLALLAALPGCATAPQATQLPDRIPVGPLALTDVTWRLVEFQSMDDAQGTSRPADPDAYTMKLGADGRVAFRLDCNRGMGSWSHQPAAGGMSGSIHFSQLATTKMLCPRPSIGEKLGRDVMHMRGYLLKDGRLSLTLMADGGIYLWEPAADAE